MFGEVRLNLAVRVDDGRITSGRGLPRRCRDVVATSASMSNWFDGHQQPHERHLVVGLVGDVGQDDEPRLGHVGVDAGCERRERRRVGDGRHALQWRGLLAGRRGARRTRLAAIVSASPILFRNDTIPASLAVKAAFDIRSGGR